MNACLSNTCSCEHVFNKHVFTWQRCCISRKPVTDASQSGLSCVKHYVLLGLSTQLDALNMLIVGASKGSSVHPGHRHLAPPLFVVDCQTSQLINVDPCLHERVLVQACSCEHVFVNTCSCKLVVLPWMLPHWHTHRRIILASVYCNLKVNKPHSLPL